MAAQYGLPKVIAYSASKTAIDGMTRAMAVELSPKGIRVNAIAPGFIYSEMTAKALDSDPERKAKVFGRTPMGIMGQATDIGEAAYFLASDAAKFITGVVLPVDGGNSIGFLVIEDYMKQLTLCTTICLLTIGSYAQSLIDDKPSNNTFSLAGVVICVDPNDEALVRQAAQYLQQDIEMVTGVKPSISSSIAKQPCHHYWLSGQGSLIKAAGKDSKLPLAALKNKWEGYLIQTCCQPYCYCGQRQKGHGLWCF